MNMQTLVRIMVVAAMLAGSAVAGATDIVPGDAAAGKQKTTMCQGCHGIPDYKTAFPSVYRVPKLGGQNPGYIVKALQEYKSGERGHPTMRAIAAGLNDQDMADLAAYYSAGAAKTAAK